MPASKTNVATSQRLRTKLEGWKRCFSFFGIENSGLNLLWIIHVFDVLRVNYIVLLLCTIPLLTFHKQAPLAASD